MLYFCKGFNYARHGGNNAKNDDIHDNFLLVLVSCNSEGGILGGDNNNSFSTATPLELGKGFQGTIGEVGDNDYFKVTLAEAGVLDVALQPVPSKLGMRLEFYDSEQKYIPDYSVFTAQAGQGIVFNKLVRSGVYYFKLRAGFNESSSEQYSFTVSLDTTDKNEWNNSQGDVLNKNKPIQLGQIVTGTIRSKDDKDFFLLDLVEPGILNLTLEPRGVAMSIELQGADEKRIDGIGIASVGQRRDLNYMAKPGIYFILLEGGFGQESKEEYTFTASLDTTDKYEINDTFADAKAINLIQEQEVKGKINPKEDKDFFKFTLEKTTTLDIVLTPLAEIDAYLSLYAPDQTTRLGFISGAKGQGVMLKDIELSPTTPTTYYVIIEDYIGDNVSNDEYTLKPVPK